MSVPVRASRDIWGQDDMIDYCAEQRVGLRGHVCLGLRGQGRASEQDEILLRWMIEVAFLRPALGILLGESLRLAQSHTVNPQSYVSF